LGPNHKGVFRNGDERVSSLQAHKLIPICANTDYCLVAFCTWIITTSCVNPRSRYEQFSDMLSIASWLLSSLGRPTDLNTEEMQPSQVSSALLVAAQKAGVLSATLSGITPSALTNGFGVGVCVLLNALADQVITTTGVRWAAPSYPEDGHDEDIDGDEDADAGDEIEDEIGASALHFDS
jgi:hypothetical protein